MLRYDSIISATLAGIVRHFGVGGIALALSSATAMAAPPGGVALDGSALTLWWCLPFAGMLLSIALFPLLAEQFWHHHFGKVTAGWALAFLIPFTVSFGWKLTLYEILHTVFLEYIPFILLLFSLFTASGGLYLRGRLRGSPLVNTLLLAFGAGIASFTGTTGAAMLLIRPLIRANEWRTHKVHTVIFFIFLVANVGGSLTPLGDPPLFIGFLKGVNFFWTMKALFFPMIFVSLILLTVFFIVDSYYYRKEGSLPAESIDGSETALGLEGKINLLFLLGIVGAVLLSGFWTPGVDIVIYGVSVDLQTLVRDVMLLAIAWGSWRFTAMRHRVANGFSWFPIQEVGKLFIGIFLTIIPVIAILKAGEAGMLAPVINLVTKNGEPNNMMYFWATGILSSFLDNAPTYLVFFNTAGGDAEVLMGPLHDTLVAISMGAVFMGANTYIGNAPNFMVKAIATERGVPMPSFFGYMIYSCIVLIPIFFITYYAFLYHSPHLTFGP